MSPRGPIMGARWWPVEYAPAAPRLLAPSSAFTPLAVDVAAAVERLTRVTHPHARDAVTLTVAAQALEEVGRHHAGHPPACDVCYWLSKGLAATRALDGVL